MTSQVWVFWGYFGIVVILGSSMFTKDLKAKYAISFNGCIYMVIFELCIAIWDRKDHWAFYHVGLALFWVWLGYKNITDRIRFKKEEARLEKLMAESKKEIAKLLFDDRRN